MTTPANEKVAAKYIVYGIGITWIATVFPLGIIWCMRAIGIDIVPGFKQLIAIDVLYLACFGLLYVAFFAGAGGGSDIRRLDRSVIAMTTELVALRKLWGNFGTRSFQSKEKH